VDCVVSAIVAASFCGTTIVLHILSTIVAAWRCRPRPAANPSIVNPPDALPPVSVVRPICGLDNFLEETLRTSFELAYPAYELIFCVASARDPAIAVVRELIAAHPRIRSKVWQRQELIPDHGCVRWHAGADPANP